MKKWIMSSGKFCRDKDQVDCVGILYLAIKFFFVVENKKHVLKPNKKRSLKHTTVQVNALKEELRTLRLQRAEHSLSLSHDPKKIAIQQLEKMKLYQKKNQQLGKYFLFLNLNIFCTFITTAGEVSWLNHQITILTDQLLSLRQGTHALSEGLARIKSGVISKQQQLEEELKQKEVSMREEISKTRRSLEVIAIIIIDKIIISNATHLMKFLATASE